MRERRLIVLEPLGQKRSDPPTLSAQMYQTGEQALPYRGNISCHSECCL